MSQQQWTFIGAESIHVMGPYKLISKTTLFFLLHIVVNHGYSTSTFFKPMFDVGNINHAWLL